MNGMWISDGVAPQQSKYFRFDMAVRLIINCDVFVQTSA